MLRALETLMAASRLYRWQLANARPLIERLSEDYGPAAVLVQSLAVANAEQPRLGTPRHVEEVAAAINRDLDPG